MQGPQSGFGTLRKHITLDIIDSRPRSFAKRFERALATKSIDAFGGVPSNGVFGDTPYANPSSDANTALPPLSREPDNPFLHTGDTVFELLTLVSGTYGASHTVKFYRNVWFDGLAAERNDHYLLQGNRIDPLVSLASGVRVTAKYVVA